MTDSTNGREQERSGPAGYGADWVGLDARRMRSRQQDNARRMREAAEREAARLEREAEMLQAVLAADAELDRPESEGPATPADNASDRRSDGPLSQRPVALIQRFHVENLESFAGPHDLPLAPLTLIYGPNSAGKSALLNGLRLFMHAVNEGRFDALALWHRSFPDLRLQSVSTWRPEPEEVPYTETSRLKLGVDYRIPKTGQAATAELGFQGSDYYSWQSSAMGVADTGEIARKDFVLEYFEEGDLPDRGAYGAVRPKWKVRKWTGAEEPDLSGAGVDFDDELFAHPDAGLQRALFRLAGQLTHFGPHRGKPNDNYVPAELNDIAGPDHWDIGGAPRWGISDFEGYEVLNQALEQLEIPHRFEPTFTAEAGKVRISGWRLIDTRSGAPVSLAEVGYGVSQLLPIIDVCLHANRRIICIEEPDLHLHPRLQAKLGNIFATSVLRRGNQVVVETHSESILLRVRRLVRQRKLHHDDVAVLYVDNTDGHGAQARRLRLGERGQLLDPWPTGFFDDRLADVLGVAE